MALALARALWQKGEVIKATAQELLDLATEADATPGDDELADALWEALEWAREQEEEEKLPALEAAAETQLALILCGERKKLWLPVELHGMVSQQIAVL